MRQLSLVLLLLTAWMASASAQTAKTALTVALEAALDRFPARTAYLADMADFARFNDIYREYFKSPPLPARSTVAVKELARGARLELTMTAVRSR